MDNSSSDDNESAHEQRIEALRNLSESAILSTELIGASQRNASPSGSLTIRAPRALMAIGLAILVFAVVVSGMVISRSTAHNPVHSTSKPLAIAPFSDSLICAHDAAWSPTNNRIALVGYRVGANETNCPSGYGVYGNTVTGIVSIYQTDNGRLLSQYHPDKVIRPLFSVSKAVLEAISSVNNGGTQTPEPYTVDYTHILWSPDGSNLYLTWLVILPTGLPAPNASPGTYAWPSTYASGVVAIDTKSGSMRVMSDALGASPYHAVGWNLATGALNPAIQQPADPTRFATLTAAQMYQWTASGSLTPIQPAPTVHLASVPTAPTSSAINSPQGDTTFSVWQPGRVQLNIGNDVDGTTIAQLPAFATDIAAISPNGRFLVEGLTILATPVANASEANQVRTHSNQGLDALPLLPNRDHALATLESLLSSQYLNTTLLDQTLQIVQVSGIYVA